MKKEAKKLTQEEKEKIEDAKSEDVESKDETQQDETRKEESPETLGVNASDSVGLADAEISEEIPVVKVNEIVNTEPGVKKVRVRFIKDLSPRVKIVGEWVEGKKGEDKMLTPQQARILRSDGTVM